MTAARILVAYVLLLVSCQAAKDVYVPKSATFYVLDRVTGKTETVMVPVGQKVQVGGIIISVQYCYVADRPVGRAYSAFLQVWDRKVTPPQLIHSAWIRVGCKNLGPPFEHPNYSIWLKECDVE